VQQYGFFFLICFVQSLTHQSIDLYLEMRNCYNKHTLVNCDSEDDDNVDLLYSLARRSLYISHAALYIFLQRGSLARNQVEVE
jgi:hypothetical protein